MFNKKQKEYSEKLYAKTKKYQKIYGFELNKGKNDVKNNEVGILKRK